MPRRDCGPHRAEWHARSCFGRTTHQTCASLYDVTLSSRSSSPGGPVRDPNPPKRPTDSSKPNYEMCVTSKRWGISARRRRASPRTRQDLRPHRP
ncbi:hypothetical protein TNCT_358541 [Trichonephila clavata]|uniref:Uncharacterized protein n=1 Tax=Trichonephila clavata TaxID=2740835 RepID=A0A8X6KRZ0_TRICU|nr:hypothetical protein TNCT_358541 [Trichonephila clavata]